MSSTSLEIAKELRPILTRLYLLYFRQAENSHISMAQLSILMNLQDHGPMRISEIANVESIRMPTASNAVNQLETMELVKRVRDMSDRRGVRVELTAKGSRELETLSETRARQLAGMLEQLTPEELEQTREVVPLIGTILERYSEAISGNKQPQRRRAGIPPLPNEE